ncbi:MAG: biotin/lipoyl-containing protein [SAR324 cluster bacterium]|nr:biotin/lipoyl-containing protein [SAR324 cluster bacterium]
MSKKRIEFMDTSFRDGFQSVFGARAATRDFLPALEAAVDAGTTYFEAGGGARFQSLFFYCNESAFDMMDSFRKTTGPDANLQTLARGINVVALNQQPRDMIDLHARMFKKHGITTIRNFDALNDLRNLSYSGERIAEAGLHHQIVITIMDLPPGCEGAHTQEDYSKMLKDILDSDIPFHSVCFKDSSGTVHPRKVYETIQAARKMVPEDMILHLHTHDTAGIGISQYLAAIEAGITRIDLAMSPVSGGTAQPDILSMWHAMKGTDYTLDIDPLKYIKVEEVFEEAMGDYFIPPESRMVSPLIPFSPMPGGALTANTMMMRDTGTLHLYPKVIKEMEEVIRVGGFGTSVTPVSQFYFQQAYLNATQGRWEKINPQYGNMVLGYFGRTPAKPDPEIVKLASEQLDKPVFNEDPLDILEDGRPAAEKKLQENGLAVNDENVFIASSCESKGIDFLLGNAKENIRRKSTEAAKAEKIVAPTTVASADSVMGLREYTITVEGKAYQVQVAEGGGNPIVSTPVPAQKASAPAVAVKVVEAPTPGNILRLEVKAGDQVIANQTLLVMEAMKMESEVKALAAGTVVDLHVSDGDTVQAGTPLLSLSS